MEREELEKIWKQLSLTEQYCDLQIKNTHKNSASIFRSINIIYKDKSLYEFELTEYGLDEKKYCYTTKWNIDLLLNEALFEELYKHQAEHKSIELKSNISNLQSKGKILATSFEETVTDGASEIESDGFVDINDLAPIDTCFYIIYINRARIMLSWVPNEFITNAQNAIDVNCVDIIQWLEVMNPELNQKIISGEK
jgi:hypothetical protein